MSSSVDKLGVWSTGSQGISYSNYGKRFESLVGLDFVTLFALHPKANGGLSVRTKTTVFNEVKAITGAGAKVELSYWCGTQKRYYEPLFDLIEFYENKFGPEHIHTHELDAEYHTTAPDKKEAVAFCKAFKKRFPLDKWRGRFSITYLWFIHPTLLYILEELWSYFSNIKPQWYEFFAPNKKKDSGGPLMRPGVLSKEAHKHVVRKLSRNKRTPLAISKHIIGKANYWQKHPGYEDPTNESGYNIIGALCEAFETTFDLGYTSFCYFSESWMFGPGNANASKYERDCARNFFNDYIADVYKNMGTKDEVNESELGEENTETSYETLDFDLQVWHHQFLLRSLGYDLGTSGPNKDGVDGIYGKKTEAAILKVERMLGSELNGLPDNEVANELTDMYERVYGFRPNYDGSWDEDNNFLTAGL